MNGLDKISLHAAADLSEADVLLRGIANDDPNGCFAYHVLKQIREGSAILCEIQSNGVKVGITVYAIEDFNGHKELISIATKCVSRETLRFDLETVLINLARINRCQSIRMHTCRKGLISLALQNGWHTAEIVLRKAVKSHE